jgi:TPR repeat protein
MLYLRHIAFRNSRCYVGFEAFIYNQFGCIDHTRKSGLKYNIICVFLALFSTTVIAEQCRLDQLQELEYTDIECQFYMGTEAYRNKVYAVAAAHWQFAVDAKATYESDEELKVRALSTLTFLTYQGLGVQQNRVKAVKMWKEAAGLGNLEARRHLGSAYSDIHFQQQNLVEALGWYESIIFLHPTAEHLDDADSNIYQDAKEGMDKLKARLTDKQIKLASEFARSTL